MRNQSWQPGEARGTLLIVLPLALGALIHSNLRAGQPGWGVPGRAAASPGPQAAQSMEASRMQQGLPPSNPQMSKEEKFQQITRDAGMLTDLVTSLKGDLGRAGPNPLEKKELVKRADKIEKLARKIKDSIKSY